MGLDMEETRLCIACDVDLAGPFGPKIALTKEFPPGDSDQEKLTVEAHSWICPGCGLVHWFAEQQDLDTVLAVASPDEVTSASPASSYERRMKMLRMLRRVRRM
jgi:hypothetical protein